MGFLAARAMYRRIAARFPVSLRLRGYIVGKLALDPAFRATLDRVRDSRHPVVDVGCGLGLLAHFLREHGVRVPIHGIDLDAKKIELARSAARRAGLERVTFEAGSASGALPGDGTAVLLDVIHYLERAEQSRVLENLSRRNHAVILRTAPRDKSWRFRAVRWQEWWTHASGWIPVDGTANFASAEEIIAPFAAAGWSCDSAPLWGKTPFNSHLFVFRPPSRGAGSAARPPTGEGLQAP